MVVVQEWWGLVDHIKAVSDRFAEAGFVALAPDFYHGEQTDEPDEAQRLLMALEMDRAAKDIPGAARYLPGATTSGNGVGAVGFCMGGRLALWAARWPRGQGRGRRSIRPSRGSAMSPTWGNYAGKSAMIHASEEDGTSTADGVQTAVRGIEKAGGESRSTTTPVHRTRSSTTPGPRSTTRSARTRPGAGPSTSCAAASERERGPVPPGPGGRMIRRSRAPRSRGLGRRTNLAADASAGGPGSAVSVCRACARLVRWREEVAVTKRKSFADQPYWGRPIAGWGDEEPACWSPGWRRPRTAATGPAGSSPATDR